MYKLVLYNTTLLCGLGVTEHGTEQQHAYGGHDMEYIFDSWRIFVYDFNISLLKYILLMLPNMECTPTCMGEGKPWDRIS